MISQLTKYLTNLYCILLNKSCDMWRFPTGLGTSLYLHWRALCWLSPIRDLHLNSGDALTTSCPSCHQAHVCCQALTAASGSLQLTYVRTTVRSQRRISVPPAYQMDGFQMPHITHTQTHTQTCECHADSVGCEGEVCCICFATLSAAQRDLLVITLAISLF